MWNEIKLKLTGVAPLIMHNGLLADPTNPVAKAMKQISGKRSKTEADYEELARLEFQGSLYMADGGPVVPSYVLEGCLINGAKKTKDGPKAKSGMFVETSVPLLYDGPRDRDGLWADEAFRLVVPVVVSRARVMRTRPIFNEWALEVPVTYDDEQANKTDIVRWAENAGRQVGLCDWRPRYGRFEVEVID
jgi:hypothetical protein